MITFRRYQSFLEGLSAQGIQAIRVNQIAEKSNADKLLVIKHDVEAKLPLALKLARIENECGHKATYYFQGELLLQDEATDILREIAELGHETAYHYDVLDACDGDYEKARVEFERYKLLIEQQSGQTLRTVCPHGNPTKVRKGWRSNKDFFRNADIRAAYPNISDIVVDFDRMVPDGTYLSDAGFKLRRIGNISGNDFSNETAIMDGAAVDWSLIGRLVASGSGVVLSVHSHRLRDSELSIWLLKNRMKFLRNGYRVAKQIPFVKFLASKMYSQARKF
ncbi:MAG: hypothetical protein ACRBBK_11620 [Paracoccaceae bacterium]